MDDDQFEEQLATIILNAFDARAEMWAQAHLPFDRHPRIHVPVAAVPLMRVLAPVRPRSTWVERDIEMRAWTLGTEEREIDIADRDLWKGDGLSRAHQFITGEAL